MNRAAKDALLGTRLQLCGVISGSVGVSTAQQTGSAVTVYDALATQGGYLFSISTNGSPLDLVAGFRAARSGGSLTIVPHASGSYTVGDAVNYIIW